MTTFEFSNQLVSLEEMLNRFAMKLTADQNEANDLLQDTFLKALAYREQFEDSTNLQAWTYTIMKNTFINNYRKNARMNITIDNTRELFFLSQNLDTFNVEPDSVFREKEIKKAIDCLDDVYKVPFNLYTQGYKYKEIAQILGLKIGTVKSRIFFTRKKLSNALPEYN